MTTTKNRTPMTALDPARTERRPEITGKGAITSPRVWQARSADGLWLYERVESDGTPWLVRYLPTGQTTSATSLPAARRWTGLAEGRNALQFLLAEALTVIARGGRRPGTVALSFTRGLPHRTTENPALAAARVADAERAVALLETALAAQEA